MIKLYKICAKNSTVCGYPGRDFDWTKFDWEQKTKHDFGDLRYSADSEYVPKSQRGKKIGIQRAPKVFVDGDLKNRTYQYLHVPYKWDEDATVYRVRPNDSMYHGKIFRQHLILKQTAVKLEDGWYWRLELEDKISHKLKKEFVEFGAGI